MSTTTVGDLLDRAEILTRSLRATDTQISTTQWRSFDATAYRLLHELVGPERVGARAQILSHASVNRILDAYPSPLAAPNPQTTYNAKQAASHLGVSSSTVIADIRESRLPATFDGRRYSIKATDLPTAADVQRADPASTHPLDQLTGTLGLLADMVVTERSRTTPTPGFDPLGDDAQVAPVVARVFAMTIVAARHALAHIPCRTQTAPWRSPNTPNTASTPSATSTDPAHSTKSRASRHRPHPAHQTKTSRPHYEPGQVMRGWNWPGPFPAPKY